jgi:hypothetical protein
MLVVLFAHHNNKNENDADDDDDDDDYKFDDGVKVLLEFSL